MAHILASHAIVHIVLASPPERLAPATRAQYKITEAMEIRAETLDALPDVDLVLDALLGYSQPGAPQKDAARLNARLGIEYRTPFEATPLVRVTGF